jgi:hypothetical protein
MTGRIDYTPEAQREFYEAWANELSSRVDDIVSGEVTTVPGEHVFADIATRRATHNA